ncbi:MAG: NADH-quinone oxidoreductase subunit I [Desulfobulbaceae bacterium]|nr:NADH-quinone oxidoreductase subunit I [Desulfobulbaceae bacterium]
MGGYFKEIFDGAYSLITGMGVTLKYLFQPVVTEQYPHVTPTMPERFRGHIELVGNEETGAPLCIVCGMCQKACPSGCITVAGEKVEGVKGKVLTKYILDFTKCSLCGICVESCKPGAITFSKEYNLAGLRKEAYIYDLKKRLEEQKR